MAVLANVSSDLAAALSQDLRRAEASRRNFYLVFTVVMCVDKSGIAYYHKDLVKCEHLFWKRVKETHHLFAHYQKQNIEII